MVTATKLTVVVPVYNGIATLGRCLDSVTAHLPPGSEVLVVSDGSDDGSDRLATARGQEVIRIDGPRGPATARNHAARRARGDILFFLDADVTVQADTFTRVLAAFRADPGLDALIGSYDDQPGADNFLSQYKNLFHHYVHQRSQAEASTFWGACGAIRQTAFWRVGGFNEDFAEASIEDICLGYRLRQAGCRIRLDRQLQVKHLKRWRATSLFKADFLRRGIPWTRLILRDRRLSADLNLDRTSRVSTVLVFALVGSLLAGWLWHPLLVTLPVQALLLVGLNAQLYRFFWRQRGVTFSLGVIPWHWFYYLYSGVAFFVGLAGHLVHGPRRVLHHNPRGPARAAVGSLRQVP